MGGPIVLRGKNITIFFALLALLGTGLFLFQYSKEGKSIFLRNHWPPSSGEIEGPLSPLVPLNILSELFLFERFRGFVDYEHFYQVYGSARWQNEGQKKYRQFIESLLLNGETNILNLGSDYFFQYLTSELLIPLSSLAQSDQSESVPRIELYIRPSLIQKLDTSHLLDRYELRDRNEIEKVSSRLGQLPLDFIQEVYSSHLPDDGDVYQLKGSIISLLFPQVSQDEKKIVLRYRHFYRLNQKSDVDIAFNEGPLSIDMALYRNLRTHSFINTFDTVLELEVLEDALKIKNVRFKFFPGKMKYSDDEGEDRSFPTGQMQLRGTFNDRKFAASVEALVFDGFSKRFVQNQSLVSILFFDEEDMLIDIGGVARLRFQHELQKTLLESHFIRLIRDLKLSNYLPELTGLTQQGRE